MSEEPAGAGGHRGGTSAGRDQAQCPVHAHLLHQRQAGARGHDDRGDREAGRSQPQGLIGSSRVRNSARRAAARPRNRSDNALLLLRNQASRFILRRDAASSDSKIGPDQPCDSRWHAPCERQRHFNAFGQTFDPSQPGNDDRMKLTRLRLLGFKSFVEPTDFLIEPGLTGVVGPNGCGKSNLVEALRWVMGESSHKAMRAADMDDVIFAGSNARPARNNAEVAMHIDNSDRKAPAQFNEHEALDVSRRIEREAGSTYRINGREVRARDVHILFADASTGSRSPALVHQGRIGEIIQAKPEQRRRVLEEAAGISGLHARRHEAELRLRAAEANLLRLEDVINQLAGQMEALKKQARQAVRYRNIAAQVRKAEATLFHLRWVAANAELAEAEHAKNATVRVVAERTGVQAEATKRQALAAAGLPALRDAEARAAAALQRLNMARETLEREETRARERMA